MAAPTPLVSVVTATWNRSRVLRTALRSALAQRLDDLELLVVGDACTDDTAEVVAALGDPRVTFTNLPVNAGEQSVPNNAGVAAARGRYVAFLNHDDLWFPDHLERCVEALERTGADVVYGLAATVAAGGEDVRLAAASPDGLHAPWTAVPATCWVLRRGAAARVGPWRRAAECMTYPSHDWVHRARGVLDVREVPHLTAVLLPSGLRRGSYVDPDAAAEHEALLAELERDPDALRLRLATAAARTHAAEALAPRSLRQNLLRVERDAVARVAVRAGVAPMTIGMWARYRRRGAFLDQLRRHRGLPPLKGR